ncbi:MAG: type II secretion system F family protein [Candidatus Micrarchaeia archaeon]
MAKDWAGGFVLAICRPFSKSRLFEKKSGAQMERKLSAAGIEGADGQGYLTGSLFISALFALASLLLILQFSLGFLESFAALAISFGGLFAMFLLLPALLASRRAALIDAELPFLMREFSTYVQIGLPFEKCVARVAKGDYTLSSDFSRLMREVSSGSPMQSALSSFSSRHESMQVKRFSLLLSQAYETGSGADSLRRASEELSAIQLSKIREQSGKMSLLSILFIATSAMLPAFFCVFAALSPMVSGGQMPDGAIWAAFLLGFPLLNIVVLFLVFLSFPPSVFSQKGKQVLLEEFLKKSGFAMSGRSFSLILALFAIALSALCFALFGLQAAVISICIAPAIYSIVAYLSGREIAAAERRLPDVLYGAASVHKVMSAERALSFLAKGGFGRLSEAFEIALRRQKSGESFASSMSAAAAHCPSPLVDRALSLLVVSYETGADMYFALREAAQDVMSFFSLVRERSAMLAIQRYTLILASAILVPAILGTTVSLVPALAVSSPLSQQAGAAAMFSTLSLACRAYLLLCAILSSAMLSQSESDPRRALLYFSAIAPVSQAVFSVVSGAAL